MKYFQSTKELLHSEIPRRLQSDRFFHGTILGPDFQF